VKEWVDLFFLIHQQVRDIDGGISMQMVGLPGEGSSGEQDYATIWAMTILRSEYDRIIAEKKQDRDNQGDTEQPSHTGYGANKTSDGRHITAGGS